MRAVQAERAGAWSRPLQTLLWVCPSSWRTAARGGPHLPHRSVMIPLAVEPDAEARIGFHNQGAGGNVHSGPQPSRPRP